MAALSQWYSAFSGARSAPAKILVVGDSVSEGIGATSSATRWPRVLLPLLRSAAGVTGGGIGTVPGFYQGVVLGSISWSDSHVSSTMGREQQGPYGYRDGLADSGQSATYSVTGTSAHIWYGTYSGSGTFTYTVDGGAPTSVNTNAGAFGFQRTGLITLGASGAHTLTVSYSSGGVQFVSGVQVYDGDESSGIWYYDAARSGITTGQYVDTANFGWSVVPGAWNTLAPDLAIIELGLNDAFNAISASTMTANLTTIVSGLRGLTKVPSIMVVASYTPAPSEISAATWATYVSAMATMCATDGNLAFVDLRQFMPMATTSGTGLYVTDGVHPNDSGHARIAQILRDQLLPPEPAPLPKFAPGRIAPGGLWTPWTGVPGTATGGGETTFPLADDFSTEDGAKWTFVSETSIVDGRLAVIASDSYPTLFAVTPQPLTGTSASIELVSRVAAPAVTYWGFSPANTGSGDEVTFRWEGGALLAAYRVGGSETIAATTTYSATAHRFLRIREASGTTYWETSTDAASWSAYASASNPIAVTSVYAFVGAGGNGGGSTAAWDNFNTVPTARAGIALASSATGAVVSSTAGGTTLAPAHPSLTVDAGQLACYYAFVHVRGQGRTVDTPSGWALLGSVASTNTSTEAAGVGPTRTWVFRRTSTTALTGTQSFTISAQATSGVAQAFIRGYTATGTALGYEELLAGWSNPTSGTGGGSTAPNGSLAVAAGELVSGDELHVSLGIADDDAGLTASVGSISVTGATIGSAAATAALTSTGNGNDMTTAGFAAQVTAGANTGTTLSIPVTQSPANQMHGLMLRVRATADAADITTTAGVATGAGSATDAVSAVQLVASVAAVNGTAVTAAGTSSTSTVDAATASGTAQGGTVDADSVATPGAGAGSGTATVGAVATDAGVGATANPPSASAAGASNAVSVDISMSTTVAPSGATTAGSVPLSGAGARATATAASATGQAPGASSATAVIAPASVATATSGAPTPAVRVLVGSPTSSATGQAANAVGSSNSNAVAPASVATSTGSAGSAVAVSGSVTSAGSAAAHGDAPDPAVGVTVNLVPIVGDGSAGGPAAVAGTLVSATTAQAHVQAVDAARTVLSTVDGTTASAVVGVPLSGVSGSVTAEVIALVTANGASIDVVDGGPGPTQTALPGTAGASAGAGGVHRLVVLQPMSASAVGAAYPAVASGLSPRTPLHAGAPRVTIGRGATVGVPVRRMLVHAGSPNLS